MVTIRSSSSGASGISHDLLDWVGARSAASPCCSICLCTHRALELDRLGLELADYLNEFDPESEGSWRSFNVHLIRKAAGEPRLRRAIQFAARDCPELPEPASDFDRTAAGLCTLGHAIIEGESFLEAIKDNPNVFKVSLDCQPCGPDPAMACDLWINAPRFDPRSQVTSIGDAFLDWLMRQDAKKA